jgi:YD repeat-containing protein
MTIPYQGGQCVGQDYFVTGLITLLRIGDGSRVTYQCAVEDAPGQLRRLSGPIRGFSPAPQLGIVVGGDTFYFFVHHSQNSDAFCLSTVRIPFGQYIYESYSPVVTPAGSFPDNCGNTPQPPQQNPSNPPPGQPPGSCPVTAPANSEFDVHTGAVTETVDLATYQSLGETRGVSLRYSSLTADPRPILHFRYSQIYNPYQLIIAKLSVQQGAFSYQVPGYPTAQYGLTGGENFWSVPMAGNPGYDNGILDAALQADLRTQPSGQYQYTVARSVQYIDPNAPSFAPLGATETATFIHVNRVNSPFGSGWALAGWQEIIENPDGSVLLLDGDGTQLLFGPPSSAGSPYTSPTGDFSGLVKLSNGTYQRTLTDQTVYAFNTQRKLASMRDRNGNLTQYAYNASGLLSQITDPVNLKTTFTYTSGQVTQITDPANRITNLAYNATGDLIRLTHPDNAVWQWE